MLVATVITTSVSGFFLHSQTPWQEKEPSNVYFPSLGIKDGLVKYYGWPVPFKISLNSDIKLLPQDNWHMANLNNFEWGLFLINLACWFFIWLGLLDLYLIVRFVLRKVFLKYGRAEKG